MTTLSPLIRRTVGIGIQNIRNPSDSVYYKNGSIALMSEQPKHHHAGGRSHIYLAVGHDRRDELIVGEAVSPIRSLIAAVKFVTQVGRVIGVQYAVSGVLDSPDDTILRAIGTYAGRCSRIGKYR